MINDLQYDLLSPIVEDTLIKNIFVPYALFQGSFHGLKALLKIYAKLPKNIYTCISIFSFILFKTQLVMCYDKYCASQPCF